jgi:hypothetical protein
MRAVTDDATLAQVGSQIRRDQISATCAVAVVPFGVRKACRSSGPSKSA